MKVLDFKMINSIFDRYDLLRQLSQHHSTILQRHGIFLGRLIRLIGVVVILQFLFNIFLGILYLDHIYSTKHCKENIVIQQETLYDCQKKKD